MPTVTVGPRVEFDTEGYVRLRYWSPEEQREYYLYLHRLTAYAQGDIDSLAAEDHAHHVDGDRWNNQPANVEAVDPDTHADRHGRPVVTADGGQTGITR